MNNSSDGVSHPERLLAALFTYGTGAASGVIGLGLALALSGWRAETFGSAFLSSMHIVTAGIGILILLPVIRVMVMLTVFVRARDYRFATIAAVVLVIILMGVAAGWLMPN